MWIIYQSAVFVKRIIIVCGRLELCDFDFFFFFGDGVNGLQPPSGSSVFAEEALKLILRLILIAYIHCFLIKLKKMSVYLKVPAAWNHLSLRWLDHMMLLHPPWCNATVTWVHLSSDVISSCLYSLLKTRNTPPLPPLHTPSPSFIQGQLSSSQLSVFLWQKAADNRAISTDGRTADSKNSWFSPNYCTFSMQREITA